MKKIVLITTTQPSANPRLVKEADAFCNAGYDVTVLYNFVADWAQDFDKEILAKAKWKNIQVGGINKSQWQYQISRFFFGFYRFINEKVHVAFFAEKAHTRCYNTLLSAAIKLNADWYIGHNPGAMAIAANAACKANAKSGFDFEDYHRGEYLNIKNKACIRQIFIEKKYASMFSYLSAASPLIAKAVENDFSEKEIIVFSLLNTFSLKQQPTFKYSNANGLRVLWFSQNIGKDRGLEQVIRVLKNINDHSVELVLVGNFTEDLKFYFLKLAGDIAHNIIFAGILTPDNLLETCSMFDIGLATELSTPKNRNICLTNKIFTYLIAGNAIIFSNTSAQSYFNDEYKVGVVFNNDEELMDSIIFYQNKENLLKQRMHNYKIAKEKLNWENESQILVEFIKKN